VATASVLTAREHPALSGSQWHFLPSDED